MMEQQTSFPLVVISRYSSAPSSFTYSGEKEVRPGRRPKEDKDKDFVTTTEPPPGRSQVNGILNFCVLGTDWKTLIL